MARVVITVEDTENGEVSLDVACEPPIDSPTGPFTPAQNLGGEALTAIHRAMNPVEDRVIELDINELQGKN